MKKDGEVATVALNRPKVLNAFNIQLHEEIYDALNGDAADDEVRCVVLCGEGKGVSAGADLAEVVEGEGDSDGPDLGEYLRNTYSRLITRMVGIEKPIVAALHGLIYGVGLRLAPQVTFASRREREVLGGVKLRVLLWSSYALRVDRAAKQIL